MKFPEVLRKELSNPLPGKEYQLKLAPEHRPFKHDNSSPVIDAAVSLIIMGQKPGETEVLLIRRPEYNGHHSGQVSFPGGKRDKADTSLLSTAIRETHEEIGINLQDFEFLGELSSLDITLSGFRVHPFVFLLNRKLRFTLDSVEVRYLIRFPVVDLLDEKKIKTFRFSGDKYDFDAPCYSVEDEIVWGATSMILSEFAEILKRVIKKNPGLF